MYSIVFLASARGQYVILSERADHGNMKARMKTPYYYLNNTCIEFFYRFLGDEITLKVYTLDEVRLR